MRNTMPRLVARVMLVLGLLAVHCLAVCSANPNQSFRDEDRRTWGSAARDAQLRSEGEEVHWHDYFFLVFRFGLFTFIICFPFVRGGKVWFQAGGRIHFRRNQNGWINGLTLVRPDMERWLILSGYHTATMEYAADKTPHKLTPDEVYALPEIPAPDATEIQELDIEQGSRVEHEKVGVHPRGDTPNEEPNKDTANDAKDETGSDDNDEENMVKQESSVQDDAVDAPSEPPSQAASDSGGIPEENSTESTTEVLFTTTMSTSCSICIEDFEKGETIRLLPRCGHAFHTDCILPWLTERQGCCPCCKEDVILRPPSDDDNAQVPRQLVVFARRPRDPNRIYMG